MKTATLALIGGAALLALVWWTSRRAEAAPLPTMIGGVPQGDGIDPLTRLSQQTRQVAGIVATGATLAETLGITGGAAAVVAPATLATAEVGISAATAAALPGAVAVEAAPTVSTVAAVGTTSALVDLASAGVIVGGLIGLGYALDWWGASGRDCVTVDGDIISIQSAADAARCVEGPAADTVGPYGGNFFSNEEEFIESGLSDYGFEWQG